MSKELFTPALIRVSPNATPQRGYAIMCGKCPAEVRQPMNSVGGRPDADVINRMVQRKFENLGWFIGASKGQHRCPQCVADARRARRAQETAQKPKEATMPVTAAPPTQPAPQSGTLPAAAPREMSRDDGRIIIAKLDETYDTDKQRYMAPWTDAKVATDLGVPRAWVEKLRDQLYGPAGSNPEIDQAVNDAGALLTEAKALLARIEAAKTAWGALQAEAQKLGLRAESIGRKVETIEKAVR